MGERWSGRGNGYSSGSGQGESTRPTIRDVARKANVSIATVSRVLGGAGLSTPKTTKAVLDAAAVLGFRANRAGQGLRSGVSKILGIILPSLTNPIFAECAEAIQCFAQERGWSVLIMTTRYDAANEMAAFETLMSYSVAGFIVTVADADDSPVLDAMDREGVPYVLVFNQPRQPGRDFVSIDNTAASYAATKAMIDHGHRHLIMIAGSLAQSDRSKRRAEGFSAALNDADLPAGKIIELSFERDDRDSQLLDLLSQPDRPTGFFCSTDILALRVIGLLKSVGLRVPEDASVVGFDGISIGGLIAPSLATVLQPSYSQGEETCERLIERISSEKPRWPQGRLLSFELLERESLGNSPDTAEPIVLPSPT